MLQAARTRRETWTFLALLLLVSGVFYALVFLVPDAPRQWSSRYALGFMWCPGLAAVVTTFTWDRTLRGLGWGLGRTRHLLIAYGIALAACLLPYLVIWAWLDVFEGSQLVETVARGGVPPALRGPVGLVAMTLVALPLTGLLSAAGEEIGWRGFLVPRLHTLVGFTGTSLIVGFIWAAWHYPINAAVFPLHRPNVPLWYANTCFTILVVGASFAHTWLRMRSGSLWPSALFHAAGNGFQGVLQAATLETEVTAYLTTEYGASFAVVGCILGLLFWRMGRQDANADRSTSAVPV